MVVLKADKRSTIVYLREECHKFGTATFYTKLDHSPTEEIKINVSLTLMQMNEEGRTTDKNLEYLDPGPSTLKEDSAYFLNSAKCIILGRSICSSFTSSHINKLVD